MSLSLGSEIKKVGSVSSSGDKSTSAPDQSGTGPYDTSILLHARFSPPTNQELTKLIETRAGLHDAKSVKRGDRPWPTFEVESASVYNGQPVPPDLGKKLSEAQEAIIKRYCAADEKSRGDEWGWRGKWEKAVDDIVTEEQSKESARGITIRRLNGEVWMRRPYETAQYPLVL